MTQPTDQYPATQETLEALPVVVKEAKSGYKTTEFWITVVAGVLIVLDGIPLPESLEGVVVTALGAVYALSRGLAKNGVPNMEEE